MALSAKYCFFSIFFLQCLYDENMALSAKYGCVAGLFELGSEVCYNIDFLAYF